MASPIAQRHADEMRAWENHTNLGQRAMRIEPNFRARWKLDDVRMDVHAAKAGGKTLLWVVGIVGALLGIIPTAYFRQLLK